MRHDSSKVWLAAAALVLPALAWLALEGRVYPRFEPYMTGDYAKIELYTRLAAEGSQRLGTESRFHIHHLGPTFFYFAAPIYTLFGETTRGMAVAALAWNVLFVVALLAGANRLAPRTGPVVGAVLLFFFLEARGIGWMLSSWNPHIAMLPFGVALVAAARLATGQGRALPVLALAGSVVLQGHMDMVQQKTADSPHDFTRDPIRVLRSGDWLRADGTTLGADNGIAIALMMALAEDPHLPHPPLEYLLTVEEEHGVRGALNLDPALLTGRTLLNLDSEEDGVFTNGCAGGWTPSKSRSRHSRRPPGCRGCARTGFARRLSSRRHSSNGPGTTSCATRG